MNCTGGFGFFWYGCAAPGVMVGAIGGAAAEGVDDVSLEATTGPESCGVTDLTSTASPWSSGVSSQRFQNAACLVGHEAHQANASNVCTHRHGPHRPDRPTPVKRRPRLPTPNESNGSGRYLVATGIDQRTWQISLEISM